MDTTFAIDNTAPSKRQHPENLIVESEKKIASQLGQWERIIVLVRIKIQIFYLGLIVLKNPIKVWKVFKSMLALKKNLSGGDLKKIYRVNGKYYVSQYRPSWPSAIHDSFIKNEIRRHAAPEEFSKKLSFVFFAITRKCPMRCEHCFEWDNLQQQESFTKADLFNVVDLFQNEGVNQFHFSGGEPMVRFKDLIDLIQFASTKSECWVLTSGVNFSLENASALKNAGCKGVVVSIDHYIPELDNLFRGSKNAFDLAVSAIKYAQQVELVTSISLCATKQFIDEKHLMPYMEFAKELGVQFVQVLEPRAVGHYKDKDVMLEEKHIAELEQTFISINHSEAFKYYPTILYSGYHQRRVGCFTVNRSLYIDSAGDVHACPFCHTKSYNVIELLHHNGKKIPANDNKCPLFAAS
jgi:MoaA/NifB/PqqE/SkfB family radical SAM enzyme